MDLPISMPGSFLPDHEPIPPTFTSASVNSSWFLPPQSPSAAASLSRSVRPLPRNGSSAGHGSRKRTRLDTTGSSFRTPRATSQDESRASLTSIFSEESPHPLVNTNYRISGGLDTPSGAQSLEIYSPEQELDYRPNRFAARNQPPDGYFPQTPAVLGREGNGRKRALSSSRERGWGKTVWAYTGGVAGKVINFCWNIQPFRGFHAGGGGGYVMGTATTFDVGNGMLTEVEKSRDVFHADYRARGSTPIPGEFPKDSFIEDYMSHPQSYQQTDIPTPTQENPRAESRLQAGWTFIDPSDAQSRDSSPVRKRPKSSSTGLEHRRPVSRASMAGRPKLTPSRSSTTNASFASPRASFGLQVQSHSRPSTAEGPARGHRRSKSSIASPRKSEFLINDYSAEPVSPEVKEFEKKVRRKDKAQDESIRKLNRQLKDMIREGKQALGTTIEIADDPDDEDEGYGEGSELERDDKWY